MITTTGNIKTSSGAAFRLVHNGSVVIDIVEGTDKDKTGTIHIIEEFIERQWALDRIAELGLEYVDAK